MNTELDPRKIFKGIETDAPVIVAVSGGSDSIALLLLAAAWARHADADLQVVSIDHGLRPEAAAEAAFVAGVSEGLDLPHVTLAWEGLKPESGISNAARNARYQLLEEFASDIKAKTILVGHTANDQAETLVMRNARNDEGQQNRGLSGISPLMLLPGSTRLIRPLLDFTRETLRDYLKDINQSWIEDPSNLDSSYERVRVRKALGDDERKILDLCKFGKLMGRYRRLLGNEAAKVLISDLDISQGPAYFLSYKALQDKPLQIQTLVMQIIIAITGGAEYFTNAGSVARVFEDNEDYRLTLGRAVIEKTAKGYRFYREKRDLPSIVVGPGEHILWDGRFHIENKSASSYFCSALSFATLQELEQKRGRKLDLRPRAILGGTPYLCGDGEDAILPFVNGFEIPAKLKLSLCVRSIEYFCPEYDFALLDFINTLKIRLGSLGPVG